MPTIARIIGGAGTGKTRRLLDLMAKAIESADDVQDPTDIAFVSFTRAARAEASSRAAERFGVDQKTLERDGWFRTLHSVAYRQLGVGKELLNGNAADRKWLENALQAPVKGSRGDADEGIATHAAFESSSEADAALSLWDTSRNRLEPFATVWSRAETCNDRLPSLDFCREVIERYESAKRLDHRIDFVDLLGRFAGWYFHFEGPSRVEPDGDVPYVPVWFFDEQQDTSALLDSVCRRLVVPARWVYLTGDPFQSIYSFAGADHRHFMSWEVAREETMPVSHRCPVEILALGETILRDCSDYFDRQIAAKDEHGEIETAFLRNELADRIDPRESWLLLARSNYHAARLAKILDSRGIPWTPTRGNGGWNAPKRNAATAALMAMEAGKPVDGSEWAKVLDYLPAKHDGESLLRHGVKAEWGRMDADQIAEQFSFVLPGEWGELGVTPRLSDMIRSGAWRNVVDGADRYASAVSQWGQEVVDEPRVKVSTVHAAKGMEADNVLLLTSTSQQCARAEETQEGFDEEARTRYVAVTRTRRRLVVVRERTQHAMEIPV